MANKDFKVKSGLQVPSLSTAGPVKTDSSGNITSATTIALTEGGTGQTSANNSINALLPVQSGYTINYTIQSDGSNVSWNKLYYQLIKDNNSALTPRRNLNIIGASFSDDSLNDATIITLAAGTSLKASTFMLMGA